MTSKGVSGRPPVLLVAIGVVLFLVAAAHHARELSSLQGDVGPLAAFVLDGLPALALAYAGYRLLQTDLEPGAQWRVCRWSVAGICIFVAVIGGTFLIRVLEARPVAEPLFPILIAAEAGGIAGLVAGYYNTLARKEAAQANAASEQLAEVNRQLKESNERLEQFAYAASHDLQEPLRMVVSYLTLVENRYGDELDEEAVEYLEYAVAGAERMREMIDGLLEYSRVETAAEPLEPVDLDAVLEDVLEDLRLQIEESAATLTVEDLPRVEGDASQLRQVFQNLVENAIKYSGDEPPEITVSALRDGDEVVVSVADDGVGIDEAHQEAVFEVFRRLESREESRGTGVGLALCERIVERHGGEIWIDAEPGEGTTVSFTLPALSGR